MILTRPAVEAGERLGFLPGDMLAKVDPYLRPLYDALYDMLDPERLAGYMERGTIEVAPLAFMRGRTLNDSFIVLDEAQNTTPEQMQMFLTRLGFGSKMVVTGDVTQVDLPREQASGLIQVREILAGIDGIGFVEFGNEDVVRHKLVQRIVEAYKRHAEETGTRGAGAVIVVETANRSGVAVRRTRPPTSSRAPFSRRRACDEGELGIAFVGPDEIRAAEARASRHRRGDGRPLLPARRARRAARRAFRGRSATSSSARRSSVRRGAAPLVHGLLHLLGYDHGDEMEAREAVHAEPPARDAAPQPVALPELQLRDRGDHPRPPDAAEPLDPLRDRRRRARRRGRRSA